MIILYLPFILQGLCMLVDEFYFHEKRGLPKWERIGHPLDTLTVLICYAALIWGQVDVMVYGALCAFSCLFITKDEWVHQEKCEGKEQWLHAMLFILHPLSFISAYLLILQGEVAFLKVQVMIVFVFMLYQTLRWSVSWPTQTK